MTEEEINHAFREWLRRPDGAGSLVELSRRYPGYRRQLSILALKALVERARVLSEKLLVEGAVIHDDAPPHEEEEEKK